MPTATGSTVTKRERSEKKVIYRYRFEILETPQPAIEDFKLGSIEIKLGKGNVREFSPNKNTPEVETHIEPLPLDVEVNAKYSKRIEGATIVRRRSLKFKMEKIGERILREKATAW